MPEALDREARQKCWNARDAYFECLTKNSEDREKCTNELGNFSKDCAASWVDYFIKRRVLQKRQDAMYAADAGNQAKAGTLPTATKL